MPTRVLRINKRKSSWETSPQEFAKAEFQAYDHDGLDLELSVYVYDVASEELSSVDVQAHSEHAASFTDTPKSLLDFDLAKVSQGELDQSPGETAFTFANDAHHVLKLRDESQLFDMADALLRDPTSVQVEVTKDQQLAYAAEHLDSQDPEWEAACAPGRQGDKWKRVHVPKFKRNRPV